MSKLRRISMCLIVSVLLLGAGVVGAAKKEVIMWTFPIFEDDMAQFYGPILEEFEKQNPDITVTIEFFPWGARAERMMTAITSGNSPDVAYLNEDIYPAYADLGAMVPLQDHISEESYNDLHPGLRDAMSWQGNLYVYPILQNVHIPAYNVDLLNDAGLPSDYASLPKTWDEFFDYMEKLTKPEKRQYGSSGYLTNIGSEQWSPWFLQAGGEWVSEDGRTFLINSEAGLKAMNTLIRLFDNYISPGGKGKDAFESRADFWEGRVASDYTWQNHWAWTEKADYPDFNLGYGPVLKETASSTQLTCGTIAGYGVFKTQRDGAAAAKWVEFLTNAENSLKFAKLSGFLSPRISASRKLAAEMGDPLYDISVEQSAFVSPNGFHFIHPQARASHGLLTAEIQAAVLKQKSPEVALEDAVKNTNQLFADYYAAK